MTTPHHDPSADGTRPIRAEPYVRSLSLDGARARQDALVDRLASLERDGTLDEFSITVWGNCVPADALGRAGPGRDITDAIETFEAWADRHGLGSSFSRRVGYSSLTDEHHLEIVLPVFCLAVFEADRLACVAPWTGGERTHTVADCLDAITDPDRIPSHPPRTDAGVPTER